MKHPHFPEPMTLMICWTIFLIALTFVMFVVFLVMLFTGGVQ